MKNIEKLKEEQRELKGKLHNVIDFMNSEEYFSISDGEKQVLNTQRAGMELYLNALTTRIYGNTDMSFFSSSLLPLMMGSIFTPTFSSNSSIDYLKKKLDESEETTAE